MHSTAVMQELYESYFLTSWPISTGLHCFD